MKKIIIAMAAIAAAFTMASCNKELDNHNENPTVGKSVITASIENDATKTALTPDEEGYKVVWKEGDKIYVGDINEEMWSAEYTLDSSSADSSKGTFGWQDGDFFCPENDIYTKPTFEKGEEYEAIYPFSLFNMDDNGEYAGGNTWKTEQTYSTTDLYIPMYAKVECQKDEEVEFTFKNLGGLLRLTVKGTAIISSITIQANEKMSGEAGLIEDAEGNIVAEIVGGYPLMKNYISLDCGTNGVTLSSEGTDFYISMPCHHIYDNESGEWKIDGYSNVTITLTDTEGRTCVKKLNNKKLVIERSKITTATFTASEFKANVPEGALPGKFTINEAGDQVYFSQGNLYWDGSAFKFEAKQYDFHGLNLEQDTWGLFGWSTSGGHYGMTYSNYDYSGIFKDWGSAVDSNNTWRTPSTDEWQYLFDGRIMVNGKDRYTLNITYGDIMGIVLYPDDYNGSALSPETEYTDGTFPKECVFLPAVGRRVDYDENIYEAGQSGFYWSSSSYGDEFAFILYFKSDLLWSDNSDYRKHGYSVRLVTDVVTE